MLIKVDPVAAKRPKARGPAPCPGQNAAAGFTLAEVLVALLIVGLAMGGLLSLYSQAALRADWSAYSLSAQMMALSGLEQCRAAKFDPRGAPPVDELVSSNFPSRVDILDVGTSVGKVTYATNTITILTISTNPPLKMVRVDCTWTHPQRGLFTNTVMTYRAANQ
ncbi:MAG TPA: prepilin-type N-terminal cleavage/methylation domain-containing protein [Verrucomicrobiae bacterium]|nr:prepilin-type N-terminal cleavage/methylation domain-containing protein [Verrucomicrobiae bacterium]